MILLLDGKTESQKTEYFQYMKSKIESAWQGNKVPGGVRKLAPLD